MAVDIVARALALKASKSKEGHEIDPTVPEYVKTISQKDIDDWNRIKIFDDDLQPIFIDAIALGFNVNEIFQGGSAVDIDDTNREIFSKLRNKDLKASVYLVVNGVTIDMNQREYNSEWFSYSSQKDATKIEMNIAEYSVIIEAVELVSNQHNYGMVKIKPEDVDDTLYATIDSEGFIRYHKAPIDDAKITVDNLFSAKGVIDRLSCFYKYRNKSITFTPIKDYPIEMTGYIEPNQEGSLDPSPTNIRKINGYDTMTITQSNGIQNTEALLAFPYKVFGGVFNNNTGILTVTMRSRIFYGTENWIARPIPNGRKQIFMLEDDALGANTNIETQLCNKYKTNPPALPAWDFDGVWIVNNQVYIGSGIASKFDTVDAWKQSLIEQPMQVVYEIAEPEDNFVDKYPLFGLEGENKLQSNTGDIEINIPINLCSIIKDINSRLEKLENK